MIVFFFFYMSIQGKGEGYNDSSISRRSEIKNVGYIYNSNAMIYDTLCP
jgi:hypothetical protein